MQHRLDYPNAFLLTVAPLLWAGNAVVGRLAGPLVPPVTLNFIRWVVALLILLPMAPWLLRRDSPLWRNWRRYTLLGVLGAGIYNALQYLALRTSTPLNVTLVASSMPVFMMTAGVLFFSQRLAARQLAGAGLSILGVLAVLSHGDPRRLADVHLVPGDVYMLLATVLWTWYSWLLTRTERDDPRLRADWAAFLLAQVVPGTIFAGLCSAAEWAWFDPQPIRWGWPLLATLAYVGVLASVVAYRTWGLGVARMGPNMASIFSNLTPLFAAVLSALFLGEMPQGHHAIAFALIVGGILLASRRPT